MRLAVLAAAVLAAAAAPAAGRRGRSAPTALELAGERVDVRWTDGDTFRVLSGRFAGRSARLGGVNALEAYGPVHRIGTAGGTLLLAVAKQGAATAAGASAGARCETDGRPDVYGRLLVSCPSIAAALVAGGLAMVFAIDGPPPPQLVALQREAQRARAGLWAGGAPPLVPTSLHSADEPELGRRGAYDRIADTRTGIATAHPHDRVYRTCEEVCVGAGADRACLTYVPFGRRYRHRPACLRAPSLARRARP